MITWEEYKELMARYNLEPNSFNAGFMPNGEPKQHSLPFLPKYGKFQGKRCAVYSEYFGVKISRDLEYWYTWMITKEEVEEATEPETEEGTEASDTESEDTESSQTPEGEGTTAE